MPVLWGSITLLEFNIVSLSSVPPNYLLQPSVYRFYLSCLAF